MTPFKTTTQILDSESILSLSGFMAEESEIPSLKVSQPIRVNLGKVSNINSHGINVWCKWLLAHDQCPVINLEECSYLFIRNLASLKGLVTKNSKIVSFYVPYFSEATGESKSVLFKLGQEFNETGVIQFPKVLDSQGNEMELDVPKEKYFSFLRP